MEVQGGRGGGVHPVPPPPLYHGGGMNLRVRKKKKKPLAEIKRHYPIETLEELHVNIVSKVASLLEPALIICKLRPNEGPVSQMNKTHGIKMPYFRQAHDPRFSVLCGSALAIVELWSSSVFTKEFQSTTKHYNSYGFGNSTT